MIFENYKSYLIILILLSSCNSNSGSDLDLNGHWHIFNKSINSNNIYFKLDIEDDSIAFFEGVNYMKYKTDSLNSENGLKNIIKEKNLILLWVIGEYVEFNYSSQNDTIIFNPTSRSSDFYSNFYGIKKDVKLCNKETEFYSTSKLLVNLPILTDGKEIKQSNDLSYKLNIYMGPNKISKTENIEISGSIVSLENIPLNIEQFKMKVPPEKRNKIELILNIDTGISVTQLEQLLNQINLGEFNEIYQRKKNMKGNLVLDTFNILKF